MIVLILAFLLAWAVIRSLFRGGLAVRLAVAIALAFAIHAMVEKPPSEVRRPVNDLGVSPDLATAWPPARPGP
jgi:hypothetical protein